MRPTPSPFRTLIRDLAHWVPVAVALGVAGWFVLWMWGG
jgi:hypothetical protein